MIHHSISKIQDIIVIILVDPLVFRSELSESIQAFQNLLIMSRYGLSSELSRLLALCDFASRRKISRHPNGGSSFSGSDRLPCSFGCGPSDALSRAHRDVRGGNESRSGGRGMLKTGR